MPTRINLAPSQVQSRASDAHRFSFNRILPFGAALALWVVILTGFRLLTI